MANDPYKYFRIEARELVDQLGKGALDLERGRVDAEHIAKLFRLAHTLKGAAGVVKQREIAEQAHAIEDVLAPLRGGGKVVGAEVVEVMLRFLDQIGARIATLGVPAELTPPSLSPSVAMVHKSAPEPAQALHADLEDMDALLGGVSEVAVQLASLKRSFAMFARARRLAELMDDQSNAAALSKGNPVTAQKRSMARELRELLESIEQNFSTGLVQTERELQQVREATARLRLLPAKLLFNPVERAARDAGASLGKRVVFSASGGDVRLGSEVLSVVQTALVQTFRNAVAHGVESESERLALGKKSEGQLSLAIERRGNRIVFICRDDGRGIDVEAIRKRAEETGDARENQTSGVRNDAATLEMLLGRGISTSAKVTEISGRGVGLDLIRNAVAELGGEIRVQTEANVGTTFVFDVPVSLSSVEALIAGVGGQMVALALESVVRTLRVHPQDFGQSASGASIVYEGKAIPFIALERVLSGKLSVSSRERVWSVVVVKHGDVAAAIGVDALIGVEEIVLRPLPVGMSARASIAGVSLDAEGNPQLVVDVVGLLGEAGEGGSFAESAAQKLPILVVDDSLTTRMLEQSILESAGYVVDTAASAEEGLIKAKARAYGLFLVDVEMPGMDGFAFVERTRSDAEMREVPAILVTSRSAPEDKQRGKDVGASGYIVKGEFDQNDLLARIRTLMGGR